ncbi:MAG: hypothetical protein ABIV06_05385 [Thermoanaerobaculia bacterium]
MELALNVPHFIRRPKLGETLRFFGILSGAEVEGALKRQANDGGRLGTCLLDSGLVDEATLLAALGAQLKVDTVDAATLAGLPRGNAALLPARAALVAHAVPLARKGRILEVAMLDPGSMPLLDGLAAVARLEIVPRLALEVRLTECLERLYDVTISGRMARTRDRIQRRQAQRDAV